MPTTHRSLVEAAGLGDGWSWRIGPGLAVDLDAPIPGAPGGASLRDVARPEWFEPVEIDESATRPVAEVAAEQDALDKER